MGGKFRARKDANHDIVVETFRKAGCAVLETHMVGRGCPDVLVRCNGLRWVEIKDPESQYGKKGLNANQKKFHEEWGGIVAICVGPEDALRLIREWLAQESNWFSAATTSASGAPPASPEQE